MCVRTWGSFCAMSTLHILLHVVERRSGACHPSPQNENNTSSSMHMHTADVEGYISSVVGRKNYWRFQENAAQSDGGEQGERGEAMQRRNVLLSHIDSNSKFVF